MHCFRSSAYLVEYTLCKVSLLIRRFGDTLIPLIKNVSEHRDGKGISALCIQPIIGDIYADSIQTSLEYYDALGISSYWLYSCFGEALPLAREK